MAQARSLKQVISVPRNGYLNRLQALASSSVLANTLQVPLFLTWEAESIAPAEAQTLFVPQESGCSVMSSDDLQALLGQAHQEMPRYLTVDQVRGILFLAGHDRGEQVFMPQVDHILSTSTSIESLVIVAGGKFHLPNEERFQSKRRDFYSKISWQPEIGSRVEALTKSQPRYLGLHIRQTDRSFEAPEPRATQRALVHLSSMLEIADVFITADTTEGLKEWCGRVSNLGLRFWTSNSRHLNRYEQNSARDALVDWRVLGGAQAIVYSAMSSFGEEASIMTQHPEWSRGLQASTPRRFLRNFRTIAASARRRLQRWPSS